MGNLTAKEVQAQRTPGIYADGGGLYLQVAPGGSKSWLYRYQRAGRRRALGLGGISTVPLAEAREAAIEARRMLASGVDPIDHRAAQAAAVAAPELKVTTFKQCAERYMAAHQASWRNPKHRAQWSSTLETYVYPIFGDRPVRAVDVSRVLEAVEPIWSTKPETAGRVRGRIEAILDWARARGYREGENPARWRGLLDSLLPRKSKVRRVEHHAALPYPEIGAFLIALRQQDGIGARALEFAILTAARTGEVIGARWDEINIGDRLWTIPAERMKAGREHRVPLSDAAMDIIEAMAAIRQHDYVFPGWSAGKPLSNMALLMTLRRMARRDLTAHGFRSTFRDWAAERTNFPSEVCEMALAHSVGDKVAAAYRRGDLFQKRRQVMDAWAKYCSSAPAGEVVPLRRASVRRAASR